MATTDSQKNSLSNAKIRSVYTKLLTTTTLYNTLIDYEYLIIDANYKYLKVRFRKNDFIHLTGLKLTISDKSFFSMFKNGKFLNSNIKKKQKYTYREINQKLNNLIKMCNAMSSNANKLLIKKIQTHTRNYPYGIVGHDFILCLDSSNNTKFYPKSIRNNKANTKYKSAVNIIAIYKKKNSDYSFNKKIYVDNNINMKEIDRLLTSCTKTTQN